MRGTDPPVCPSHAGIQRGGGAPRGNRNAERKGGFYGRVLREEELADLVRFSGHLSLEDEIGVARVAVRRVLEALGPEGGATAGNLDPHLIELLLQGARTVARLLREQKAISGEAADGLARAFGMALDNLNKLWGTDL